MLRAAILKALKWNRFSQSSDDVLQLINFVETIYGSCIDNIPENPRDKTVLTAEQSTKFQNIIRNAKSLPMSIVHQLTQGLSQKKDSNCQWDLSSEIIDEHHVFSVQKKHYRCIEGFQLICDGTGNYSVSISVEAGMDTRIVLCFFLAILSEQTTKNGLQFVVDEEVPQNLIITGVSLKEKFTHILHAVEVLESEVEMAIKGRLLHDIRQTEIFQSQYPWLPLLSRHQTPFWGGPNHNIPILEVEPMTPPPSPVRKLS